MKSSTLRTRNKIILPTAFVLAIIAFVRNILTIYMFLRNKTIRTKAVEKSELNNLASGDIFPNDNAMWNSSNQQAALSNAEVEVKDNSTLVVEVATSKVTNESFHSVQIASAGIISNHSTSLTLPPKTMGAFIHLGKTGGSSLSQSFLLFGCHSFQLKAWRGGCLKNITKDDHIISKTTTYYHIPDFENGKLHMYDQKYPYQYFVITIRDPLSRAISSFLYTHPENRAVEGFNDLKRENGRRFITVMQRVKNVQTEALEYIKERKYLGYVRPEERMLYRCFPNLEVYTKLLANFTDYTYVNIKDSNLNNTKSCAHLAKATLHHATPRAMVHNHFDLRTILGPLKNVTERPILAIRTEFMKDDWLSSHKWLGEEDVAFDSVAALRNSTMTEYPVKNDVSKGGRKNLCLALKDEYRIYMRILVLAKNLSKETVQDSVAIAQRNCPWLNLSLPDVHAPEKFVTETGIKWEF